MAVALLVTMLAVACGGQPAPVITSEKQSPTASAAASAPAGATGSPSPSAGPSATPAPGAPPLAGPYGLLISAGTLELVNADASIFAHVPIAASSVQYCSSAHDGAMLAPPVSATDHQVYFRDGDNKIRMVVPPSSAVDVTAVPGNATTVSFFSVSPDDQRIAVVVEDLSGATSIALRLYVEDLHGGGHHADIFSTVTPKGKTGMTLWPMGWHAGALVLSVMPACSFEPANVRPVSWHVANAATATRMATINASNCTLSYWPSPAGVACETATGPTTEYDWTGKVVAVTGPPIQASGYPDTAESPSGGSIYFATGYGIGVTTPSTQVFQGGPGPYAMVQGHSACGWIDEDHLLAPDAVIQFNAQAPGNLQISAPVTALAQSGVCAGRFPGAL